MMACVPTVPISSVCPSGLALATSAAPTLPPAPALFSTMTGCPRAFCNSGARARASTSVVPPGANGPTMRSALVVESAAFACRSARYTMPEVGPFTNMRLVAGIAAALGLQLAVGAIPVMQRLFNVAALGLEDIAFIAALALAPVTIIEVMKWLPKARERVSAAACLRRPGDRAT